MAAPVSRLAQGLSQVCMGVGRARQKRAGCTSQQGERRESAAALRAAGWLCPEARLCREALQGLRPAV